MDVHGVHGKGVNFSESLPTRGYHAYLDGYSYHGYVVNRLPQSCKYKL